MFRHEVKQFFKHNRVVCLLFFLPFFVILGLGLFRGQFSHDFRRQESQQANRLSSDLNWAISTKQKQGVSADDPLLVSMKEAETIRFDYSVAAFYEEWDRVNQDKLKLWRTLLSLNDQGKELLSVSRQQLETELPVIDWQVSYQVGRFDTKTTRESSYLMAQASPYLLGVPLLLLFNYLVGMPLLRDLFDSQQSYLRTLPMTYGRLLGRRLGVFLMVGLGYGLSIIVGWGLYHYLFDQLEVITLLHYPLAPGWPFWQGVLALYVFWLGISVLFWLLMLIINRFVQRIILVWLGLGITVTLMAEFSSLFKFYPIYSLFSYWDIHGFVLHQSWSGLLVAMGLILCMLLGFWYLVVVLSYARLKRGQIHSRVDMSLRYFQARFEWLKIMRGALWSQLVFSLIAFFLYYTVSQGIQYYQLQVKNIEQKSEQLSVDISSYRSAYPTEELYQEALAIYNRQAELVAELQAGKTMLAKTMEYEELKQDVDYLQHKDNRSQLPLQDWIFMPNAYINYQIAEWKKFYGIDYQVPGGPYWTLYLPSYEESPRSGEDEPPLAIDITVFEAYLARVSKPMRTYTGLGIIGNFVQDRIYLLLWGLLLLFLVSPAVQDRESGRWKFQAIQPVSPSHLAQLRRRLTFQQICLLGGGSLFLLGLAGMLIAGVGDINLPFVRYFVDATQWGGVVSQRWQVPATHQYFELLPLWYYYLEGLALLLSVTYFVNSLCHFVASWSKSMVLYVSLVISILAIGYVSTLLLPSTVQVFSPFRYLDIGQVLNGQMSVSLQQPLLTHWMGILMCSLLGGLVNVFVQHRMKGCESQ